MGFLSEIFGYLLNFFYELIHSYGIAIIIFSVLLRLLLIPITIKQQKTMKKSAKMQEKMKEIQHKYKNNPEKLNQETIELYKTEHLNPFSGCFSAILQLLIILSVFWMVSQPLTYMKKIDKQVINDYKTQIVEANNGQKTTYPEIEIISKIETEYEEVNTKLAQQEVENREELEKKKQSLEEMRINMEFLGLDLSKVPTQNLGDWRVYVIPALYVITSFISIKITTSAQKKAMKKKEMVIDENGKEASNDEMLDSMQQMNNSMLYMMPIMSISIAVIAPLGLALYWLVSNVLMIIERLIINKIMEAKGEEEDA